jgi:NADH-quinone oxidoreductase subunit B
MEKRGSGMGVDESVKENVLLTTVDSLVGWGRKSAIYPLTFGLACCALEFIAAGTATYDMARFGAEIVRPTPRQADLMIVAGTVTKKMAPFIRRIWEQMPDPKWVIALGACASSGGIFKTYSVVQGVDQIVPVDIYVPGCPPRPESFFAAFVELQKKISRERMTDENRRLITLRNREA